MAKTRTVYLVGHNMAGYLGDSENYFFVGSKRKAYGASRQEARDDRQALNEGAPRSERYSLSGREGDYWLTTEHGASYHYWTHDMLAERVKSADLLMERCANCNRLIGEYGAEEAWYVPENEAYLCDDCI